MPTEFVLGSVLHSELADFIRDGAHFRKQAEQFRPPWKTNMAFQGYQNRDSARFRDR